MHSEKKKKEENSRQTEGRTKKIKIFKGLGGLGMAIQCKKAGKFVDHLFTPLPYTLWFPPSALSFLYTPLVLPTFFLFLFLRSFRVQGFLFSLSRKGRGKFCCCNTNLTRTQTKEETNICTQHTDTHHVYTTQRMQHMTNENLKKKVLSKKTLAK